MERSPDTTGTTIPNTPSTPGDGFALSAWLPYAAPFVLFLLLTAGEGQFPRTLYPIVYAGKTVLVTIAALMCRPRWRNELCWSGKAVIAGLLVGLVGLPLWLGVDAITPSLPLLFGTREAYNPFVEIPGEGMRLAFLSVRLFGLAILVPVIEEIFWRSFLLRFATDQERWQALPIGTFSPIAFVIVAALFGIAHPEYLAGIVFAMLMAGLLRGTKNLPACIIAHGVTNLSLAIYVLITGNWKYW